VSLALVAKGFGAVPKRGVLAKVARRAAHGMHDVSNGKSTRNLLQSVSPTSRKSTRKASAAAAAGLQKAASLKRLPGGTMGGDTKSKVGDDGKLVEAPAKAVDLGEPHDLPSFSEGLPSLAEDERVDAKPPAPLDVAEAAGAPVPLIVAPDPRESAPSVAPAPAQRGSIEIVSDRLKEIFAVEAAVAEPKAGEDATADGTEDPMPEPNLFRNSTTETVLEA